MRINGIEITQETIQATREWFAENARACIAGAESGEYFVNDLSKYRKGKRRCEREALNGDYDYSLTFVQRALYIQTGECVPLLA